jgi:hypothetical protein
MSMLDWLEGNRYYRTTEPRRPSPAEAKRGPRTRVSFSDVKMHTGQDLVAAITSGDENVLNRVQRIYSLSDGEIAALKQKVQNNHDIENEVDVVANRIYWEGRG